MALALWQSIPFACILLPLASAALTSALKGRYARIFTAVVMATVTGLTVWLEVSIFQYGTSYTYTMGHYTAPWGNEIRAGDLESVTAFFFSVIMLLSLLGGIPKQKIQISQSKQNLYCVMLLLLEAALMAQVFTNDLFTGYVFIEIMTLTACVLIACGNLENTLVAAVRYMIMNLLGSGLFLLGLVLLYDLTGHLLMSNIKEAVAELAKTGEYDEPLTIVLSLMTVGLAIKSALFPFHTWVPDAYGSSTPTSASVLSSLVSKGYIFLLIKIYVRVFGLDVIRSMGVLNVLFGFGVIAMIAGSVLAIRQTDIRRMVAYSSVAQIGYIYMGLGLGTEAGLIAALFHMLSHGLDKSMLFIAIDGLSDVSDGSKSFHALRGAGHRNVLAGAAFTIGALGMVGFPFLAGFTSKMNFAMAGIGYGGIHMGLALAALVISTFLNTLYFLRTMITIYRKPAEDVSLPSGKVRPAFVNGLALVCFMVLNVAVGLASRPLLSMLEAGLSMFG